MESPDTLSQVIDRLRQQGYTEDLNRHDNNPLWLDPDAYQIDTRVLVNGYGPAADAITAGLEQRLHRWPVT